MEIGILNVMYEPPMGGRKRLLGPVGAEKKRWFVFWDLIRDFLSKIEQLQLSDHFFGQEETEQWKKGEYLSIVVPCSSNRKTEQDVILHTKDC